MVDALYRRAAWRLLPLLFLCYIVAYLDRVNVGFAKLQMTTALQWSDAVYGFGAGIFFIGYFAFEVPSNLLLERVGARRWIARIMISWGLISCAFAFVDRLPWGPLPGWFGLRPDVFGFYALRFLLGLAEAGFFPGIILYLTYWFPQGYRARTVAWFMTAIAVANVVGSPLSGWIMQAFDGSRGWMGWQWLFVLEGIPSVLMGLVVWWWLPDGPRSARWLTPIEQEQLATAITEDQTARARTETRTATTAGAAMRDGRVWALAFVYFTSTVSLYGVNFWMPTLIQELGLAKDAFLQIGLLTAIPWGIGGVAMVLVGQRADRALHRAPFVIGALLLIAAGLVLLAAVGHTVLPSLLALTLTATGVLVFVSSFWSIPTAFLQQSAAAAGIAWINSIGNLGGQFGPDLIGRVREATGGSTGALLTLATLAVLGALVTARVAPRPSR